MKRELRVIAFAAIVVCSAGVVSAKSSFDQVPRQALVELKATVGKPFTSGLVFIDGKYMQPPYKVERYGTAFRINGQIVSGQVIPWDEFLKTQEGVRIERKEQPVSETPESDPAEQEEASESDYGDDFDDLFDDNPKPRKAKPAKVVKSRPAPKVTTTVMFDGEFKHNVKTKAMLDRLNKMRTNIELALRNGGACFFGSRYGTVRTDKGPADMFLRTMPSVMRSSSSFGEFSSAARAKGIVFLSDEVLYDLYNNKFDYIMLRERAKAVEEERRWAEMLNNSGM